MSDGLKLWRLESTIRDGKLAGRWVVARDVTPDTAEQWLEIWRKAEPDVQFKISDKRPTHRGPVRRNEVNYRTVGVLAGAYRGRDIEKRLVLTHTGIGSDPDFDEPDAVLCRRVPPTHCTAGGIDEPDAAPTCPLCLKRDPRFGGAYRPRRNGWSQWESHVAVPGHKPHQRRTLLADHGFLDEKGRHVGGWAVIRVFEDHPGFHVTVSAARDGERYGAAITTREFADETSAMKFAERALEGQRVRYAKKYGVRRNGSQLSSAEKLYETFHQFEPEKIGAMPHLRIPSRATHVGEAKVMYYCSDKLNPETGEDEGWIHYFHDHEGDVKFCVVDDADADGDEISVPTRVQNAQALVRIGDCEGFEYEDFDGKIVEAEGTGRLPEWYATPDGKALLVIQDKRRVLAILWGGGLDVKAEGVVG